MSQYKSAIRSQPHQESGENSKYREQARQLQEAFPRWSNEDLQILLNEVNGDIQLAATRLTDGTVEQWGEVSRKKDKKPPVSTHPSKSSVSVRGDSRGGRGGRGGRAGPGRGGAVSRGRGGPPRGGANGHISRTDAPRPSEASNGIPHASGDGLTDEATKPESQDQQNGTSPSTPAWTEPASQAEIASIPTSVSATSSSWAGSSGLSKDLNGSATHSHITAGKQASKSPATSKLSWAQIARPQEKLVVVTPPPPPQVSQAPPPPPTNPPAPPTSVPEFEPVNESQGHGWEEPTTVEVPTWDDEPQTHQVVAAEPWPPSTDSSTETVKPETPKVSSQVDLKAQSVDEPGPAPEIAVEAKVDTKAITPPLVAAQAAPTLATQIAATPSPKLTTRPAVLSHRSSARYKVTDQPVTMPLSFGSGIEKVGMQFGSLSLAGDGSVTVQPELEAPAPSSSVPASPPLSQVKAQQQEQTVPPSAPPATAPTSSTSLTSVFQQQQQQSQTLPPPQTSTPHHSIPTSISQPTPPTQNATSHTAPINSPLQQFAQQQSTTQLQQSLVNNNNTHQPQPQQHQAPPNLHQQTQQQPQIQPQPLQHLPQQLQQNHSSHHSYTQHGLPTHIDPAQSTQPAVQQQPLQNNNHSSYFRQAEGGSSPYFHAPTPPAVQAQDNSYSSFGQLGAQAQHQQGSHLGGFASSDYGYSENSRFYETYAQQTGFGGRNPLAHDEVKGIPGSQQSTNATIPPSAAQAPQQHAAQANNQAQSATAQGPQQTYPPPVPYYYTHAYPQNQYYGSPYSSGYVPQPFVKYPTMFQPGPPGPGSAANPTAKQPAGNVGVGVQPQANPYNPGIYQQAGYDDYQPHPHHSQHQHQHTHSLGLSQGSVGVGSGEYGKQLYGGAGQGAMQGFMGLGGQSGSGGAGPTSNAGPRSATSPEAAYKPYAAKDVASSTNRGAPVQQGGQGQGQAPSQGQGPAGQVGPQGQGFYGGNRFGSGVGVANSGGVGGGPQQGGHHQQQGGPHLGYPQGGSEPNFYGYQPRQQQGYWQ